MVVVDDVCVTRHIAPRATLADRPLKQVEDARFESPILPAFRLIALVMRPHSRLSHHLTLLPSFTATESKLSQFKSHSSLRLDSRSE